MTTKPYSPFCVVIVVAALMMLTGCFGKSQPPRFYTLTAEAQRQLAVSPSSAVRNAAVGIGPIQIADYLNQSKIINRSSDNRIEQAEYHQWAGSFEDNLTEVLAENLAVLVPTERIYLFPWRTSVSIDYQVALDIIRCDGRLGEAVRLVARWRLLSGEEKQVITVKRSSIDESVRGNDYDALVAAQSRALARLSQEIAAAIHAASPVRSPELKN
jgi:uncharacterized lipoprotein YmbA